MSQPAAETAKDRLLQIPLLVHFQYLDGEGILLDLRNQLYFGLDDVGCRIWELVREKGSELGICASLVAEYDVPESEVRQDLAEWIDDLLARGLLELVSSPIDASPDVSLA